MRAERDILVVGSIAASEQQHVAYGNSKAESALR